MHCRNRAGGHPDGRIAGHVDRELDGLENLSSQC
jgi:hypothetical protein